MKKRILEILVILSIAILTLLTIRSYSSAEENKLIDMKEDGTLIPGEEIKIDININNTDDKIIDAFEWTLEYDTNILELVGEETEDELINLDASDDNWEILVSKNDARMTGINPYDSNTGMNCTLTFKVKDNISAKNTTVSLKNILLIANSKDSIDYDDVSIEIKGRSTSNNIIKIIAICLALAVVICIIAVVLKKKKE